MEFASRCPVMSESLVKNNENTLHLHVNLVLLHHFLQPNVMLMCCDIEHFPLCQSLMLTAQQ